MSKLTKKDLNERLLMVETLLGLHRVLPEQISNDQANNAIFRMQCALSRGKELAERKPQLKQLDQSIFDGLDEKWQFAAVDEDGAVAVYLAKPISNHLQWYVEDKSVGISYKYFSYMKGYDTSNWQNSLIERDIAKELLEVDLSSELTGSELCKAMINRGDKIVLCIVKDHECDHGYYDAITRVDMNGWFDSTLSSWRYAFPINNQGEPLTASEVGL